MARESECRFVEDPNAYRSVDPEGAYTMLLAPYGPMMSTAEVAEFLGVTRQCVTKMLRTGQIPDVPHGCDNQPWRVPKLCLLRYLNAGRSDAGSR